MRLILLSKLVSLDIPESFVMGEILQLPLKHSMADEFMWEGFIEDRHFENSWSIRTKPHRKTLFSSMSTSLSRVKAMLGLEGNM